MVSSTVNIITGWIQGGVVTWLKISSGIAQDARSVLHFAASSLVFAVTATPYSAKSADVLSAKFWARAATLTP